MIFKPQINVKLAFLLTEKWRYKVAHGGRNGGKSFSFADAALARMISNKTDIAVCRELQTTIKGSVHKLIKERIYYHHLHDSFRITDDMITYLPNGSTIIYKHLHDNITEVKGLQGIDICWIFEAEKVSKDSWDVLDPTIRKPGCEIWIEFNPDHEDDFIYDYFITKKPDNAKCVEINYLDNPMCPADMITLAEQCKRNNINEYNHIWLGKPTGAGGLIYPKFNKEIHVDKCGITPEIIDRHGQLFNAMDPATVYYPFILWAARLPKGKEFEWVIYNEFPTLSFFDGQYFHEIREKEVCSLTMLEIANIMKVLDQTVGDYQMSNTIHSRYIDTRFAKASGARSWANNTEGLVAEFAQPKNGNIRWKMPEERLIDVQRDVLRGLLNYNENIPICSINEPKIWIMPHCKNLIASIKGHRFDLDNKTESQKYKDPVDTLRILLAGASKVAYEDPSSKETEVPFLLNSTKTNVGYSLVGAK
jgi:phage terminase large subunit